MSVSGGLGAQGPQLGCQLPGARHGRDPARAIKRGPSRVSAETVAATQRDRLYDGLVHSVAEKGYANARVTDICRAAGVTRPVFYELFQGKDDAFLATYRHGTQVLLEVMETAYNQAQVGSWPTQAVAAARAGADAGAGADGRVSVVAGAGADAGAASEIAVARPGAVARTGDEAGGERMGEEWQSRVRAGLSALLDVLAQVPAFAKMAIVEIDAVGPAAWEERRQLLRSFHRFFAQAPTPPPPAEHGYLVAAVVGGVYAQVFDCVSTGRVAELPAQSVNLSYCLLAPFLGPTAAAAYLAKPYEATPSARSLR